MIQIIVLFIPIVIILTCNRVKLRHVGYQFQDNRVVVSLQLLKQGCRLSKPFRSPVLNGLLISYTSVLKLFSHVHFPITHTLLSLLYSLTLLFLSHSLSFTSHTTTFLSLSLSFTHSKLFLSYSHSYYTHWLTISLLFLPFLWFSHSQSHCYFSIS